LQPREVGLPVHAYVAQEQIKPEGTEKAQQVFVHLPTSVSQTEAEEIGVEHLLRDVKDATISTLSTDIVSQAQVRIRLATRCAYHNFHEFSSVDAWLLNMGKRNSIGLSLPHLQAQS
jgi:hypothetical protein